MWDWYWCCLLISCHVAAKMVIAETQLLISDINTVKYVAFSLLFNILISYELNLTSYNALHRHLFLKLLLNFERNLSDSSNHLVISPLAAFYLVHIFVISLLILPLHICFLPDITTSVWQWKGLTTFQSVWQNSLTDSLNASISEVPLNSKARAMKKNPAYAWQKTEEVFSYFHLSPFHVSYLHCTLP